MRLDACPIVQSKRGRLRTLLVPLVPYFAAWQLLSPQPVTATPDTHSLTDVLEEDEEASDFSAPAPSAPPSVSALARTDYCMPKLTSNFERK